MDDFSIFSKSFLPRTGVWPDSEKWDIFVSAFNSSERVSAVFASVRSDEKHWLIFPEYGYRSDEYPKGGQCFVYSQRHEADFIGSYLDEVGDALTSKSLAVDITGFMRPHLLFLLTALKQRGVRKFDAIYSEPQMYREKERTAFSDGPVMEVRPVAGFEGVHVVDTSNDVLILGIGYDHQLLAHVAESKDGARIAQIFGLPSLSADMYQQSVLRSAEAQESLGGRDGRGKSFFASASDPFDTANRVKEIAKEYGERDPITNLYLSPLSTKPQVLGFGLYYLYDQTGSSASILFPFCNGYARETSTGIGRVWKYIIEF